eukprot:1377196-Amorphochlora_amoeboformis.AAC.1
MLQFQRHDYGIKLKEYMRHATDTGTPEFQIARATQRIYQIVQHMEVHRKDLATRYTMLDSSPKGVSHVHDNFSDVG